MARQAYYQVENEAGNRNCGHRHRSPVTARECAGSPAQWKLGGEIKVRKFQSGKRIPLSQEDLGRLPGRYREVLEEPAYGTGTMANIYIADRIARKEALQPLKKILAQEGHAVTSQWLSEADGQQDRATLAAIDIQDIAKSDTLIVFSEPPRNQTGGGCDVELGIALATGKRIILIGEKQHIFHELPQVHHFPQWSKAVLTLLRTTGDNGPQTKRA